jgi:hypothetical protein
MRTFKNMTKRDASKIAYWSIVWNWKMMANLPRRKLNGGSKENENDFWNGWKQTKRLGKRRMPAAVSIAT